MSADDSPPATFSDRPALRADLRDLDHHASWREVRSAMHLTSEGGHE